MHVCGNTIPGEPDAGNPHVGFDEGRVGRTHVLPSLLLYRREVLLLLLLLLLILAKGAKAKSQGPDVLFIYGNF